MHLPTAAQWQRIDQFLFMCLFGLAFDTYREITEAGINESVRAIADREQFLLEKSPELFKTKAEHRAEARSRLETIPSEIVIIEGYWDGDSHGWCITLSAITEGPSRRHPKYTQHWLYDVRGMDRQVERAIEFGTELAKSLGVEFSLTDTNTVPINYEKRWWDEHG
jgi:hypothetical protein